VKIAGFDESAWISLGAVARWIRMSGLLRALVVAVVALCGTANAQAFRPRGKTPSTKPAAKATAAPSKQPTRAAGPTPRRVVVTKPESDATTVKAAPTPSKGKAKGKAKGKEDIVIVDDDDDDVQIKDE
jgi:hypothetical protein